MSKALHTQKKSVVRVIELVSIAILGVFVIISFASAKSQVFAKRVNAVLAGGSIGSDDEEIFVDIVNKAWVSTH